MCFRKLVANAVRGPARGRLLRVAHLVQHGEDRMGLEVLCVLEVAQERKAELRAARSFAERELEQVVEGLHSFVEAEMESRLLEAPHGQPAAGWVA